MVREHLGDHRRDALAGRDVQKFVWTVRVGMRAEHAGDDELRLRKLFAEHRHERDAAALAHIGGRRACASRAAGIWAQNSAGRTAPVASSSSRDSNRRRMRKLDGTTPEA